MSQPDDELRRRLADLAESAGPWADPLPAVMRRTHAERRHAGRSQRQAQVVVSCCGRHNPRCRDRPRNAMLNDMRPGWASLQQSRPRGNRPPALSGVGGFAGSGCATMALIPEAGTPACPCSR
jgi:hypothetical protein